MSAKSSRIIYVFALIAFVQAACYLPPVGGLPTAAPSQPPVGGQSPPPADGTAMMQTALAGVAATLTQAAGGAPAPSQPPPLPEATMTSTSLPTLTPTVTLTPTPEGAFISVSTETKCRTGPGKVYDQVGGLVVGKTVEVFGRDPSGQFYYIRNPNNPATFCWVWANYATPVGNFAAVPVFTPAPTPTPVPGFSISYLGMITCAGNYAFRFELKNTGSLTWQSIKIDVTDSNTATTKTHTSDTFKDYSGCPLVNTLQDLEPDEVGVAVNNNPGHFTYNPTGHNMTATFTLYLQNGLSGQSETRTITFTP